MLDNNDDKNSTLNSRRIIENSATPSFVTPNLSTHVAIVERALVFTIVITPVPWIREFSPAANTVRKKYITRYRNNWTVPKPYTAENGNNDWRSRFRRD